MSADKKQRYPGQAEKYRDNPADEDYEKMLGHSALNVEIEDFLRMTQEAVRGPEERARENAAWDALPMAEKMQGPPVPYLSTPGLRKQESGVRDQESGVRARDVAPPFSPLAPDGSGAGKEELTIDEREEQAAGSPFANRQSSIADRQSSPPSPQPSPSGEAGAQKPPRKRTPRCTGKESRRRLETVHQWLLDGNSNAHVIQASKQLWGIGRRQAQLNIQKVKKRWANEASSEDFLAHQWKSKEQHDRLLHRVFKDLDQIEDPTKSAGLLRTGAALLKARDAVMEEIRHHRATSRRDHSPDSKAAKKHRQRMIYMPFDELQERLENLRNHWFHEWNQCRIAEKMREGTLGPRWIENPYVAAVQDPPVKPEPTLGPPGSEWCI